MWLPCRVAREAGCDMTRVTPVADVPGCHGEQCSEHCPDRGGKPVQFRCGRATVTSCRLEARLSRSRNSTSGTRDPAREVSCQLLNVARAPGTPGAERHGIFKTMITTWTRADWLQAGLPLGFS